MKVTTIVLLALLLPLVGCGSDDASNDSLPTSFNDGTYLVGTDIASGTYRTKGETPGEGPCSVFTSKKPDDASSIVDTRTTKGPREFSATTGLYLTASGCQTWKKD